MALPRSASGSRTWRSGRHSSAARDRPSVPDNTAPSAPSAFSVTSNRVVRSHDGTAIVKGVGIAKAAISGKRSPELLIGQEMAFGAAGFSAILRAQPMGIGVGGLDGGPRDECGQ